MLAPLKDPSMQQQQCQRQQRKLTQLMINFGVAGQPLNWMESRKTKIPLQVTGQDTQFCGLDLTETVAIWSTPV